ncbi:hypothetical protein GA0070606_6273 [Micromonospora citrea]|uniref:Uncharacterized protein n=1 Tax=Micromonospora citrea TaxID=47855 RepID=A0A1C6W2L5_9ACTN|nr:hypothetical protein GA0070606_6273 [Micromonospora citrea]
MTVIDKIAWIRLENGAILSSRSRGKDVYHIPGGKRELSAHARFMVETGVPVFFADPPLFSTPPTGR